VQDYPPERCKELIFAALGKPELSVEVIDIADWRVVQRVAVRFQDGRIFLVGDAAHTMPPYLGLGVNTAIQSAQNLAWKLIAVLKGNAAPELLTTYQTERHPVGMLVCEQSLTGSAAVVYGKNFRGSLEPKESLPLFYPMAGYRYRSEAILSEDVAPKTNDEIELLESQELKGLPGSRVPHLWLERQGQRISTLDLLDGHFVLLTGAGGTAWSEAATTVATRLSVEIAAYRIGPDADLLDLENGWPARMGVSSDGAVLIRPDGFVAWRSSELSDNPVAQLESVLSHILCRSAALSRI
jgi:hypothetical protein